MCTSWNKCTGANSNTSCSCGNDCGGKCSSCSSSNSFGWGSCSCGSNCSGGCKGTCKGNCGSGCNTGCSSTTAVDLYTALSAGLNEKLLATDMKNINDLIKSEASRRSKTVTAVTFTAGNNVTATQVQQLQSNLSTIGFATSQSMAQNVNTNRVAGQELVDKTMDAYETKITS